MSTAATRPTTHHDERMLGQTVVVIGGSSDLDITPGLRERWGACALSPVHGWDRRAAAVPAAGDR